MSDKVKDPGDWSIGDIIRAATINPLDAIVRADALAEEPAIEEQVRAPNDNELAEIEKLAIEAASVQDQLKAAQGDLPGRLSSLRKQLKQKFLDHGLKEFEIAGRPPLELTETSSRKPTRKAIIEILEEEELKNLGPDPSPKEIKDAKSKGKMKALNLWNKLKPTVSQSISIPDPTPPELSSPY